MSNYEEICYKNPFLKQVLVRIDFSKMLEGRIITNPEIEGAIRKNYPRKEKDRIIRYNDVEIDSNAQEQPRANKTVTDGIKKTYTTDDTKNKVYLSNKSLIFEFNLYSKYEHTSDCIRPVIASIYNSCSQISTSRVGVRYINIISEAECRIQKKFFSSNIASVLFKPNDESDSFVCIRSLNTTEYKDESFRLNFRYGVYNPNYPNKLEKRDFILDFDCYTVDAYCDCNSVHSFIDKAHSRIQELFESSIKDPLRKVMKNE